MNAGKQGCASSTKANEINCGGTMCVLYLPPDQTFWSQKACAKVTPVGQQFERFNAQRCNYLFGSRIERKAFALHILTLENVAHLAQLHPMLRRNVFRCNQDPLAGAWHHAAYETRSKTSKAMNTHKSFAWSNVMMGFLKVILSIFGEKYQYCMHFLAWHLHLNDISRSPSFERQFVHLLYIMQNLACHKNLNSSEWFEMDRFGEKTPFSGHGFWCVSLRNLSSHPPRCSIVPDGIRSKSHPKSSYHLLNPSAFQKTKKKFQLPTENLLFFSNSWDFWYPTLHHSPRGGCLRFRQQLRRQPRLAPPAAGGHDGHRRRQRRRVRAVDHEVIGVPGLRRKGKKQRVGKVLTNWELVFWKKICIIVDVYNIYK